MSSPPQKFMEKFFFTDPDDFTLTQFEKIKMMMFETFRKVGKLSDLLHPKTEQV